MKSGVRSSVPSASVARPVTYRISREAFDRIMVHAQVENPRECCGVLLGRGTEIVDVVATRNLAQKATEFVIDPQGHIGALRDARRRGLEVVGFYHSHPHTDAVPSPLDLAEASYRDCVYLIASLACDPGEIRLFQYECDRYVEVSLTVG